MIYRVDSGVVVLIIVNGFISSRFAVSRNIRQGCPLSALIAIHTRTALAIGIAIRQDLRIRGLKLPGTRECVRLAMYADDTNSFIGDVREIESTLEWFQLYAHAFGAKNARAYG